MQLVFKNIKNHIILRLALNYIWEPRSIFVLLSRIINQYHIIKQNKKPKWFLRIPYSSFDDLLFWQRLLLAQAMATNNVSWSWVFNI